MHVLPRLFRVIGDTILHCTLNWLRSNRFGGEIDDEFEGIDKGGVGEAVFGDDVEVTVAEEEAVGGGVGVEPAGEVEGGLDEEELAVGVP